jgi:predicted ABC-type ATPase
VKLRVEKGGHNIPEKVIERRYFKGLENFKKYFVDLCDTWMIWDNTGNSPKPVAQGAGNEKVIFDNSTYKLILNEK